MATATVPGYRTSYTVKQRSRAGEHEGDMEGTTHAATGFLLGAGIGLLTSAGHAHGALAVTEGVGHDVLYGVLTAGFALLPDADHPKATFAYAAGWLSHGISHLVAVLFGGHRQGMHSLFGVGVAAAGTAACTLWWPNHWALGCLAGFLAICIAAGLAATGFVRRPAERLLAGCALAAVAVVYVRGDLWWLVALGMALHIFEDEFTGHGCALLWPFTSRRFGGDGRQMAKGRKRPAPRRPVTRNGKRPARPAAPPARPPVREARGPQLMCPSCWVGECDACPGRGCGCPQPRAAHPHRQGPKVISAAPADPVPDDLPPF
jgi:membrane-bound metal-dependent hydrolase YbcI (DUF457 family)